MKPAERRPTSSRVHRLAHVSSLARVPFLARVPRLAPVPRLACAPRFARVSLLVPVALLALATLLAGAPAQGQLFEAVTFTNPSESAPGSGALSLTDGNHLLTAPAFVAPAMTIVTMARNPRTGQLFAIGSDLAGSRLVHVDFLTGAIDAFGAPLSVEIRSLAFDSKGNLYAFAFCDTTYPNALFTMAPAFRSLTYGDNAVVLERVDACQPPCN
jgi:hypothetical protein